MEFERIAIIGADPISISIALALKGLKEPPTIFGYDSNAVVADLARVKGAFDRVERKPERAVQDADLVIVAVPLSEVREMLAAIAPSLRPESIVTDTARLKGPVLGWAHELLPENTHFIGGHPILNPAAVGLEPLRSLDDASPDLLRGALYCLVAPRGAAGPALNGLTELIEVLEAQPFFIDAVEHDGMQAGVEQLPDLLSTALLLSTVGTPGWEEMRKFAGRRFAEATEAGGDPHEDRAAIILNRENLVLRLNGLLSELMRLRDLLSATDSEALAQRFAAAEQGRAGWIEDRAKGMWGRVDVPGMDDLPTSGDRIGRLFFGERVVERLKGNSDRSRKK
jgi:prephenate dehydrogenase